MKETVEALQKVEARARADLAETDRAEDQEAAAQKDGKPYTRGQCPDGI
ncbi:hypothetical protein ACOJBM_41930 [Rhizobium beringeri]